MKATMTQIVSICPHCENNTFYRVYDENGEPWYLCTECGTGFVSGDICDTVDEDIEEKDIDIYWEE